jgi:hypothetical protein
MAVKKSSSKSVKKTAATTAKAKPVATTAFRTPLTKSQLLTTLSETTGVPKKQTAAVPYQKRRGRRLYLAWPGEDQNP